MSMPAACDPDFVAQIYLNISCKRHSIRKKISRHLRVPTVLQLYEIAI